MSGGVRYVLEGDLRVATWRLERARKALTRAERAVELRAEELRDFADHGTVPKRKRVLDAIAEATIQRARAQGLVVVKRGRA